MRPVVLASSLKVAIPRWSTLVRRPTGVSSAAVWSALTAWTWYAFGLVPLQLALVSEAGLDADRASSSIASAWLCAAVATTVLSLVYRQPIAFAVPSVGLIFAKSLADALSFEEILGATMVAGLVVIVLALSGASTRLVAWMPPAIVMAMFAGVVLDFARRAVAATVADLVVAGATVAGYALGRVIGQSRISPMGLAALSGGLAVAATQATTVRTLGWEPPYFVLAQPTFSLTGLLAVSLPLVIILIGMNLVPSCAFLDGQEYRPPTRQMALAIGLAALVSPCFSGFAAAPSRDGGAIMAGPDAGPAATRYLSTLVGGALMLVLAFAASTVVAAAALVPLSFVVTLTGLSMLGPLQSALGRAFDGALRFGPTIAFIVAVTPFSALGLPSSCWALLLGVAASWLGERSELRAYWRLAT